jgi:hypothetical protein
VIPAQSVMQTVVLLLPAAILVTPVVLTVPFVVRSTEPGMQLVVLSPVAAAYPAVPAVTLIVLPFEPVVNATMVPVATAGTRPIPGIPAIPVSPNVTRGPSPWRIPTVTVLRTALEHSHGKEERGEQAEGVTHENLLVGNKGTVPPFSYDVPNEGRWQCFFQQ